MSKDDCCYLCNECPISFPSLDLLEDHLKSGLHLIAPCTSDTVIEKSPDVKMEDFAIVNSVSPASSSSTMIESPIFNEEGLLPCNLCARKFANQDQLNTHHVHTHRQKPNYVCEVCNQSFSIKRDKQTHMRIHAGEKPQKCNECGKEFGTRQLLKKHQMWHTGKRTHVCHECGKSFFQRGHLSQHYQIHKNVRPFACSLCEKTFIFKFDLNRHMKIHAERGYCCTKCGKSFARQCLLDEHQCKKPAQKKSIGKLSRSPLSDFSQSETVTLNSPSTVGQQSPVSMMAPLSPNDVKKENGGMIADLVNQGGIARMAQMLMAQHQQRMAIQNFIAQQQVNTPSSQPAMNLTNSIPIQLQMLLQQYRQQTQPQSAFHCAICSMNFDNQAMYVLHCSRAHFNNGQSGLIPSPALAEQIVAPIRPDPQPINLQNGMLAQALGRTNDEHYETATTSANSLSSQKMSMSQPLIAPDWLSSAASTITMPNCQRTHSNSPPCEKCVENESKYSQLEQSYSQTRSELDRLKEAMSQFNTMANLMNLQRAAN